MPEEPVVIGSGGSPHPLEARSHDAPPPILEGSLPPVRPVPVILANELQDLLGTDPDHPWELLPV